jgi:hypothetical protein
MLTPLIVACCFLQPGAANPAKHAPVALTGDSYAPAVELQLTGQQAGSKPQLPAAEHCVQSAQGVIFQCSSWVYCFQVHQPLDISWGRSASWYQR